MTGAATEVARLAVARDVRARAARARVEAVLCRRCRATVAAGLRREAVEHDEAPGGHGVAAHVDLREGQTSLHTHDTRGRGKGQASPSRLPVQRQTEGPPGIQSARPGARG